MTRVELLERIGKMGVSIVTRCVGPTSKAAGAVRTGARSALSSS